MVQGGNLASALTDTNFILGRGERHLGIHNTEYGYENILSDGRSVIEVPLNCQINIILRMPFSGLRRYVALLRKDISEERIASIIRVQDSER
jgi:hypothetical protein